MTHNDPLWALRVAECYRRLGQRENEHSALVRAAHRYEERGFHREALAIWTRVQSREPKNAMANEAVSRLRGCLNTGLDRLRSSLPPPQSSAAGTRQSDIVELLRSFVQSTPGTPQPDIPREPRVPDFGEGEGALEDDGSKGVSAELQAEPPPLVPHGSARESASVSFRSSKRSGIRPAGLLARDAEVLPPAPSPVNGGAEEPVHRSYLRQRPASDLGPATPRLPTFGRLEPPRDTDALVPMPIIPVGETCDDEGIIFLEAEVLPHIEDIDIEW